MPATGSEARPPQQLRLRLAVLFCLASVLSGLVLLALAGAIGRQLLPADVADSSRSAPVTVTDPQQQPARPELLRKPAPDAIIYGRPDQTGELKETTLKVLVLAIAGMTPLSFAGGWFFAGRVLRPVRTMTDQLQQITDRNLHERLALPGRRDELTELAATIDGLLGRLESSLEAHRRFVANAAHELRTPLTVEHALLEESLIDREPTVDSYRTNFERLIAVSRQRSQLLESLLTLSSSEHGLDHREPADLAELTTTVLADLDASGLRVSADLAPAPILGDPRLVTRLIVNLCDNAVHYNVAGGRVDVTTRRSGRRAVLTVANTGPVVPPEQVDRLFEPFQRLHRVVDDDHHGLGLSIVRAIVAAHDATVTATARPRGGLEIEVAFTAR